jgi:hypothetical protein
MPIIRVAPSFPTGSVLNGELLDELWFYVRSEGLQRVKDREDQCGE